MVAQQQIEQWVDGALRPTADPGWVLEVPRYDPIRESDVESRFAIGNGFLGMRGARAASRGPMWVSWLHTLNWASWPRTYVAGLFDTPNTVPPVPARGTLGRAERCGCRGCSWRKTKIEGARAWVKGKAQG